MSMHLEDPKAKSNKPALKVGGEFGGIAGIVVVGGVVAVGIAAGAIAYLIRQRRITQPRDDDENHGEENSAEICSRQIPNESCTRKDDNLALPGSEKAEEIEPLVEIVENFSDMDFSADWMDMNKSKDEESPRSHFSVGASSTSIGSDSEDLSDISQNSYRRHSEIDSSRMNSMEGNFNFTAMEQSAGKSSSHFKESDADNEGCISSVKQLIEPKIEYEESVDSFDGLEEECEEVGRFVELEGSVEEQAGEKKLPVFEGWEGNESGQCNLDCKETYGTKRGIVFHNGNGEHDRVGLEEDGGPSCSEQFHVPFEGIDPEKSEDSHTNGMLYKEIVVMQVSESLKEDLCLGGEDGQHKSADSEQDITVVKEERWEEKIDSGEGLNCDEKEFSHDVIDLNNSEDYKGGVGHSDEEDKHQQLEESEEDFCPIKEQSQQETVLSEELKCPEIDENVHLDGHENEIVCTNEEECVRKEQFLQDEKFETNVGQYLQERTESEEQQEFCTVNEAHKVEQWQYGTVGSGDSECLDYKQHVSHCVEKGQYGDSEESKEHICPIKEHIQQGSVQFKELEYTEIDVHDHEDGHQNDIVGANEDELLCEAQFLQEENFEFNVEQWPQERTGSEESEDCKEEVAHKGEQYTHETFDSSYVEGLGYKGGVCRGENLCPIQEHCLNEIGQSKEMECIEVDVHVHQNGQQNVVAGSFEEVLLCKEQCLQKEKFESNIEQCLQERTESIGLEDSKVDVAHKGEQCQNGTVDSRDFESLDYKEAVSHHDEKDQHREFEDSVENFCRIKEQCGNETAQCKELEWTEADVHVHQDGHQKEIVGADEEVLLCKEQCLQEEKLESNVEWFQEERIDSEELENCKIDVANKGEKCQYGTVDSGDFESLDYKEGVSHRDEKGLGELQDSEEQLCPIKAQIQQDTVQFQVMAYTEADVHVYQDGHKNDAVGTNEEVLLCKEQCPREEKFEYNVKNCPQEGTETEEELENCKIDVEQKGERCQNETVDSRDFQSLDYTEDASYGDEKDQHRELEDSEENFCPIKEKCQNETTQCKELECTEIDVHVHQDGLLSEIAGADEEVLLRKEQCLEKEKFECHVGLCPQKSTELEEFVKRKVDVAHTGEQCQFGAVNSGDFVGLDEGSGTSHENGSFQYGELDSKDFEGVDESVSNGNGSCEYGAVDLRELEDSKDSVRFEKEKFDKEMVNSKEDIDLHIGSEENLLLQEENLEESIEDVSDMNMQCEENTADFNEIEDVRGDAVIFKEQCQEELLDSKEPQNSVQDVLLRNEGCKKLISESEELELTEEDMPITQEQCQQETVDSEKLEQSENAHSSNEPCQLDIVYPKETIDIENMNQYNQCQKVDIDGSLGRESENLSGNALILKELCPNEAGGHESSDNEDPQTNNKPEEVDTKELDCSSGDALCFKEYQQDAEAVDTAATESCKQDPQNFPELEEIHAKKSEHSNTHKHLLNYQKEGNQEISTNNVSGSCKLVGVSKVFQENDESTGNETDSVAKRVKNGCDPLHSSKLGSKYEEGKSLLMQPHRHLPMKIRIIASLFALCLFLFLFASRLAKISASRYAL